ncbi:MAG: DnaJ domain-containing protein [Desulfomonilaceae bacterium]
MNLQKRVLETILKSPGTSKRKIAGLFNLSSYRLHRVFRHIERDLQGHTLVHHEENGVWVVKVDPLRCLGTRWSGAFDGGYCQCSNEPEFPDRRCYEHSECQNPEMVAFKRKLDYLVGPAEPTAFHLSHLTQAIVRNLTETLREIAPFTQRDEVEKSKFLGLLDAALKTLRWKDEMRRRRSDNRIPPELFERHRRSSGNTFEYSLKKHFLVLEVATDATRQQVLEAWRKLARRYHPDATGGDAERMKTINLAKEKIFRMKRWG